MLVEICPDAGEGVGADVVFDLAGLVVGGGGIDAQGFQDAGQGDVAPDTEIIGGYPFLSTDDNPI